MVRTEDLIGIFDVQIQESIITMEFLQQSKVEGSVEILDSSEASGGKSLVMTRNKIFYSPISSITLKKRAMAVAMYEKTDLD